MTYSIDTTEKKIGGLSYREHFNWHGALPAKAIDDLLEIYEGKSVRSNVNLIRRIEE